MVSCTNCNLTVEIYGTQVSIHWLWMLFYGLAILGSFFYKNVHYIILVLILNGPVLLFTIVTYMIGITMMVKAMGGTTEGIIIYPFWGFTKYGQPRHDKGPSGDLRIAMVGQLMFMVQGAAWFGLFYLAAGGNMLFFQYQIYENLLQYKFFAVLFSSCVVLNIVFFVLNMLPGYPLAGGKILAAILLMRDVERSRVALIVGKSGLAVALCGCIYGVVTYLTSDTANDVFIFVTCFVVGWYSVALIRRATKGNLDDHQLFYSSRRSETLDVDNVNEEATLQVIDGDAVDLTGQVSQTSGSQTDNTKSWWNTKIEGTKTKEAEIDYGS